MRRLSWPTAVILALAAVSAAGQARPDFSGRWTSEPDPATAPPPGQRGAGGGGGGQRGGGARGDMGSGWGPTIAITQEAARLTVEYVFFSRGDLQPPLRFVYALDGSESQNSVMMGRGIQVQTSKTAWNGDRLVITTVHTFADPSSRPQTQTVTQTVSLDSATSLVVETTRAGVMGGPPSTTRTVYRKM